MAEMSEAIDTASPAVAEVSTLEDINLPLFRSATNPRDVVEIEARRANLLASLKEAGYSPNHKNVKEAARENNPYPYRENLLFKHAKSLLREGLRDAHGNLVTLYDACDFVCWLYHGYKWLNALVCLEHNKPREKRKPIMGFVKDVVDGAEVISHNDGKKTVVAQSRHTADNWAAWSGPQMIDPLKLRSSTYETSHKKSLYHYFVKPAPAEDPKKVIAASGDVMELESSTLSEHIDGAVNPSKPAGPKPAKSKKPKASKTAGLTGGGAGRDVE